MTNKKENITVKETVTENTTNTATSALTKKFEALKAFIENSNVKGIQIADETEEHKIFRSLLNIEGQNLPVFIVLNNSIYSFIQVHLVTIPEEKRAKCLPFLNELNEKYSMLNYFINSQGNIVLNCNVTTLDNNFEPAIFIALIDQIILHLQDNYSDLMKKVWED